MACALQVPGTASAASVSADPFNPGGLVVSDLASETNAMTVHAEPGVLVVDDTIAALTTTAPQCALVGTQEVRCVSAGVRALTVRLGGGNDSFRLDDSVSTVAGIGLVSIDGQAGDDQVISGEGAQTLFGSAGNDRLDAGAGGDTILGQAGDDIAVGGDGSDDLRGGTGNDQLSGGAGDDDVRGDDGADVVSGGDGADRLEAPDAADVSADPTASLGADTVDGGAGDDRIGAGPEADPLAPDVLSGGGGRDTVVYALRSSPVAVALDGAANDGAAGEGDNVAPDVEDVVGGSGNDVITGSDAANFLDGGPGDDILSGLGAADTLDGGLDSPGNDRLFGGDGNDTLSGEAGDDYLDGGAANDTLSGAGGTDTLVGGDGADTLAGGPGIDIVGAGNGDDTLYGGDPVLIGADGGDQLDGGPGHDKLYGGPGDDTLDGGLGPDVIVGEDGRHDVVTYQDRTGPVTVTFNNKPDDGEQGESDNVASSVEDVVGGTMGDTLAGDDRANSLNAGPGDDSVDGGPGPDVLAGGKGADVVRARDRASDVVNCGGGNDLAIVDRLDTARQCKYVDNGRRRRPPFRQMALVRSRRGRFELRLPDSSHFVSLSGTVSVPLKSTVDGGRGTVRVVTTTRRNGPIQGAWFSGGAFSVDQTLAARPATLIRVASAGAAECRAARARKKRPRHRLVTRTDKRHPGRVAVVGDYSIGAAFATRWLTEDRCDGTFTRVMEGTVRVTDLTLHRTVSVRAGHSYLARPG